MTDFGYSPAFIVTEEGAQKLLERYPNGFPPGKFFAVEAVPMGPGEGGRKVGQEIDTQEGDHYKVVVPEGVTVENWRVEKVEHSPPEDILYEQTFMTLARPLPPEMPFLPIEQLPEDWKDGREVLVKQTDEDCISVIAVCFFSQGFWYSTFWVKPFPNPTHFCPIPLKKEVT